MRDRVSSNQKSKPRSKPSTPKGSSDLNPQPPIGLSAGEAGKANGREKELMQSRIFMEERMLRTAMELQLANEKLVKQISERERVEDKLLRKQSELHVHQIELQMQNEELRRLQTELEISRARYFDLYDMAPVGYCTIGEDGLVLETNLMAASLLGLTKDEMIMKNLGSFVLPEDQELYRLHRARLWDTRMRQVCEIRLARKEGACFWVQLEETPMFSGENLVGYRAVLSDVTERIQAQKALQASKDKLEWLVEQRTETLAETNRRLLMEIEERNKSTAARRESEERFRAFMDNSPTIAWAKDGDGRYVYLSQPFERRFGARMTDWRGKTDSELWPAASTSLFKQNHNSVMVSEKTVEFEAELPNPDGSASTWWIYKFPFRDTTGGRYVGAVGLDVTSRKQMEEVLRRSEENFRSSLEDSPLGVRIVTVDGKTLYANRALLDIYGYESIEELEKTPLKDRYTQDSYMEYKKRYARRIRGKDPYPEYKISIVRRDGEVRHLHVLRRVVTWDRKEQFLTIYQDISDRIRMEDFLRKRDVEVAAESMRLSEANTALRVLLQRREEDVREMEQKVVSNFRHLVMPYLDELQKQRLSPAQLNYLHIIEANLQKIVNPFLQNLTNRFANFTSREVQVASMIRDGKPSKEIADILMISVRSVEFHRDNIRKKLGLANKASNLRAFLLSLSR